MHNLRTQRTHARMPGPQGCSPLATHPQVLLEQYHYACRACQVRGHRRTALRACARVRVHARSTSAAPLPCTGPALPPVHCGAAMHASHALWRPRAHDEGVRTLDAGAPPPHYRLPHMA